jgi:serine/threonine-protein kinase
MGDLVSRLNAALAGRYRIERMLGEGGMDTVYLAEDVRHQRNVALEVLRPELAAVVGAERFLGRLPLLRDAVRGGRDPPRPESAVSERA